MTGLGHCGNPSCKLGDEKNINKHYETDPYISAVIVRSGHMKRFSTKVFLLPFKASNIDNIESLTFEAFN
ncbi:hypothetical protein Glove_140g30 [Diversispora epigaea]|uniref:Uncharacterized protein n=1 Tax=Diversispora epigaea TaxID=1348612 RepID=A0A397IVF4_9GLOM|nr:hypothetical protein Glove_140g30 [Diversispora epigaea]